MRLDMGLFGNLFLDGPHAAVHWREMLRFFSDTNLTSPEAYERAGEYIDIEDYTDAMLIRIWAHEQRLINDARRTYGSFNRETLPRQVFWLLFAVAEVDSSGSSPSPAD